MKIIELKNITKTYKSNTVLENFSMEISKGEFMAITGPSGCGKSTLLNIVGLLENFDSGEYIIFGNKNVRIDSALASKLLREKIGYLFQNYALIDDATVYDNLRLAINIKKQNKNERNDEIIKSLQSVGLNEQYCSRKVFTLSGGEQQRVAFARILLRNPEVVLADEPTGSLDAENRCIIMNLLKKLNKRKGTTVMVVTHDQYVADMCDRVVHINALTD